MYRKGGRRSTAGIDVPMKADRDVYWDDLLADIPDDTIVPCEPMDSEDPLYILYTSGSTGKPKGVVHVHGGYAVGLYATTRFVFDVKDEDIFWCTADVGWVTAHSYLIYGPLMNGTTNILFEGTPTYPTPERWWSIVEKYNVTILYTSPTAIRGLMRFGEEWPARYDLSSLRLLGSVGEPINPEAWIWTQSLPHCGYLVADRNGYDFNQPHSHSTAHTRQSNTPVADH